MIRRRLQTITILICAAWAFLPSPARAVTEIRFCYWANHVENVFIQQACENFERDNPDIKVKREWFVGDYGRKMQLVFITGKAADIILMDDEFSPTYGVRGYLEDLRPYINRESDDCERMLADELRYIETPAAQRGPGEDRPILPTAMESFNYRGFQGGIPWDGNVQLVYINKDLFDQAGLSYPDKNWTWDEFRELSRKLTKDFNGDGTPEQFGTNVGFGFFTFEPILWSFGGDILDPSQTRCIINSPRGLEAGQFVYQMRYIDRTVAWATDLEGFNTEVQLLTGRVALVLSMSFMIPALNRVGDVMHWGLAPMPIGPHGDRYTRVTWDGISINARTTPEKKELAWRFIKHFINEENQSFVAKTQRGLPIRRAIAEKYYVNPDTSAEEEVALDAVEYGKLTPITPRYQELRDALVSELERLDYSEATGARPEEAFPKMEAKANKVLEKEMADWSKLQSPEKAPQGRHAGFQALLLAFAVAGGVFALMMLIPPSRRAFFLELDHARHMFKSRMTRMEGIDGILFASPWLIGLCLFTAFPIIFSIVLSFSQWDPYEPIDKIHFVGFQNFARALSADPVTGDPLVRKALYNTLYYAFFAVPLGLTVSLTLALLLNQKIRGITIFRTAFYLPSIISGVATVVLWMYIFNPTFGPLNTFLRGANNFFDWTGVLSFINLPVPKWLSDPAWSKPSLIIMSMWGAGGAGMLIFLAGLQGVPDQLYEVAELDGAGPLRKFWNITIPMLTPTIYFNLIMGVIGALKVFMQAYILTDGNGGVDKSLLFYVLHLYTKAFVEYEMGYAAALAWILFIIIMSFTLLIIRSSAVWVYYEGERRG